MSKKVDLTGYRFGKLKVKKLIRIGSHGKEYLCKCDCGNEKIIRGSVLTSGKQKACGCLIGKSNKGNFNTDKIKSKIGERYGRLIIIDFIPVLTNGKSRGYKTICECECGNKTTQQYADIKKGKVISCGCWAKEQSSITGSNTGLNNRTKNCSKWGWHIIKDDVKIKMRSGYEVMYAIILENKRIEWEYEPKCFKLQNGMRYTPDFYLPKTNEWIEVKGMYTEIAKIKHQKFIEEGNKLTLVFIEDIQKELPYSYAKFKKGWVTNHRVVDTIIDEGGLVRNNTTQIYAQ